MSRRLLLPFILMLLPASAFAEYPQFQYSGFARVVAGYLDANDLSFDGYDNELRVDQHSLFGLQGEYSLSEDLSITGQLLAHSSSTRDSGVEWLYLSYTPSESLEFKLGKLRTPIFELSDALDIGFAYPYILPPQPVYSAELLGATEGVDFRYAFGTDSWRAALELFAGRFDGEVGVPPNGESGERELDLEARNVFGAIGKFGVGNLEFRTAIYKADLDLNVADLDLFSNVLSNFGLTEAAEYMNPDDSVRFLQSSLQYESLIYFLRLEYMNIRSDSFLIEDVDSFYVSAGYYLSPLTFYGTFAHVEQHADPTSISVERGVSPVQDILADAFDTAAASSTDGETDSFTLGVRWDVRNNLALKAEATILRGSLGPVGTLPLNVSPADLDFNTSIFVFGHDASFYALALEWTF